MPRFRKPTDQLAFEAGRVIGAREALSFDDRKLVSELQGFARRADDLSRLVALRHAVTGQFRRETAAFLKTIDDVATASLTDDDSGARSVGTIGSFLNTIRTAPAVEGEHT
jgi:hypothetical protein